MNKKVKTPLNSEFNEFQVSQTVHIKIYIFVKQEIKHIMRNGMSFCSKATSKLFERIKAINCTKVEIFFVVDDMLKEKYIRAKM